MSERVLRMGVWLASLALAVWVMALAPRGFFSGDSGVKLVQAHGLWLSGFSSRALPYDHDVDPGERWFPYQRQDFTRVVDGERQGTYSILFCGLVAVLVALFGLAALPVPALLGAWLMLWGMARAGVRSGVHPGLVLAATAFAGLATPVLFYASQLAEHTLAAGLAIAAYALICPVKRERGADPTVDTIQIWPSAAGVLVALAATLRPEGYCMVAALGLSVALLPGLALGRRVRHGLAYLAGCVPVLAGYWLLNLATAGTWDPLVGANSGARKAASSFFTTVFFWGELPRAARPLSWLACAALPAVVAVVAGLVARRLASGTRVRWLAVVHAIVGLVIAITAVRAQGLATGRVLAGLFCVTPLLAYGLLAGPWQPRARAPWLVAVLFLVQLSVLPSGGNAGGLQLGARLLMPALPFLCLLAAMVVDDDLLRLERGWQRALACVAPLALVAVSVLGMARGLPQATTIARQGEETARNAAAVPAGVIICRRGWESQLAAPVLLGGKTLYEAPGDLRPLLEALYARGERSVAVIDRRPVGLRLSGGRVARTVGETPGWLHFQHVVIEEPRR
ncbi:MAG TPA: hypothetical protein VNM90_12620 [Haliangium sp.]|nr:hypothetical protein [Haliangium sp.]